MAIKTVTIPIYENNGKSSKVVCTSTTATAATVAALADAIKGEAGILGMVGKAKLSEDAGNTPDANLLGAPTGAQRGQRLMVSGTAAVTGVQHTLEIATASNTLVVAQGSDNATVPAAIVSALNAIWTDANGNAITVATIGKLVHRTIN